MDSWRELIGFALENQSETWADVVSCTLSEVELDARFAAAYGENNGKPFTVWTRNFVYFPKSYDDDGGENVAAVARNPDGKATAHV